MKFSQIAPGKTYLGPKGIRQEVISISPETNEVTYRQEGEKRTMPGQEFAKQATTAYRDRSRDKPKEERRTA
jgi:hypothetical protein